MHDIALTPEASQAAAGAVIRAETRNLTVTGPDLHALLDNISADMQIVPTMEIDTDDMATELLQSLGRISTVAGAMEAERKERKKPLIDTGKWLDDGYNPMIATLTKLVNDGKAKLTAYSRKKQEEARIAREAEERKRREEAEAAARAEAEAHAKAQAAIEAAAKLHDEGSEQVAQALATDAMVQVDQAREAAQRATQALYTRPAYTSSAPVKGARETWKAEVVNKSALIVHIAGEIAAGNLANVGLLEVAMPALNAMARLQKEHLSLPGVRPVREESVAVRRQAVAA